VKVAVLVADSAEVINGKVYCLGLGWSDVGTPTPPHALVVFVDIDWTETNQRFAFKAELVNSDGQAVTIQTEVGEQPVAIEGELEAGRPVGVPHGTPVRIAVAASFGPLALVRGTRYEWRVTIDGQHDEAWTEGFTAASSKTSQTENYSLTAC
jgi:hypothetical protein